MYAGNKASCLFSHSLSKGYAMPNPQHTTHASDTVTSVNLPNVPPHPSSPTFKSDVETIVDARMRLYEEERRRHEAEMRLNDVKRNMKTYGVGGVVGLGVGIGGTLLMQRLRNRRPGPK